MLTPSARKRLLAGSVVALGVAILLSAAFLLGVAANAQARATDALFALRPSQHARSTVIYSWAGPEMRGWTTGLAAYLPPAPTAADIDQYESSTNCFAVPSAPALTFSCIMPACSFGGSLRLLSR
jgi:hypothetical protein